MRASPGKDQNSTTGDDWIGELLFETVKLIGVGVFRFALRWPDAAVVLNITAVAGMLGGWQWALAVAVVAAVLVWDWRLAWPQTYDKMIGRPTRDFRRSYLVYRRRWGHCV